MGAAAPKPILGITLLAANANVNRKVANAVERRKNENVRGNGGFKPTILRVNVKLRGALRAGSFRRMFRAARRSLKAKQARGRQRCVTQGERNQMG